MSNKCLQLGTVSLLLFSLIALSLPVVVADTTYLHTYIVDSLAELDSALSVVVAGDLIQIRQGTYQLLDRLIISSSGTSYNPITIQAYAGETVTFDGSLSELTRYDSLIIITGNNIIINDFKITASDWAGITVLGTNATLTNVQSHHNSGPGLDTKGDNTHFISCTGNNNVDAAYDGVDADGLGASAGATNAYFFKCVAYENSDDGIDVYDSSHSTLDSCVAYSNGLLNGDGNGFKLNMGTGHRAIRCISYDNVRAGFDQGDNSPNALIDHCTSYDNGIYEFICASYTAENVSYTNNIGALHVSYDAPVENSHNSWTIPIINPNFKSTDSADANFLSLAANSACRNAATDNTDIGALQYGQTITTLINNPIPTNTPTPTNYVYPTQNWVPIQIGQDLPDSESIGILVTVGIILFAGIWLTTLMIKIIKD